MSGRAEQDRPASADLQAMYGDSALQGSTREEQRAIRDAMFLTILFTGGQVCVSLSNTAESGGC